MHALPRQAASRAVATSSRPAASSFFICPSCSAAKTVTTPASARRHLGTAPARRHTAASTSTSAPPPPPPAGYARLTSRRLISIAGVDAAKFLQGIVTASTLDRHQGFYTGFLNATGRVLHDVWIYPDTLRVGAAAAVSAGGEAFLIEVDAEQADTLLKHLKRYRLRSKFQLAPVEEGECGVWQVWNDNHDSAQGGGGGGEGGAFAEYTTSTTSPTRIILPDTRAPGLGHRVLSTAPTSQVASEFESLLGLSSSAAAAGNDEAYRIRRYLLGVPEGQREIPRESSLPLEANMDLMGGIDFRKGCYVGQELTIRTKHRGVVRKRILPCVLYHGDVGPERLEYDPGALSVAQLVAGGERGGELVTTAEDIPQGSPISKDAARKGRGAGMWLRGVGNVGLALCRLQVMTDVELPGEAAAGGGGLAPFDPSAEFVVKIDDGAAVGSAGDGTATGGDGGEQQQQQQQQKQVKIKAFVPPWLRQKLDETNAPKH